MKKLSEILKLSRTNRPDEWSMDNYSRMAENLENQIAELKKHTKYLDSCLDIAERNLHDEHFDYYTDEVSFLKEKYK